MKNTKPRTATAEKQKKRLIRVLEELFQLDQPDLDFGFYRIMHAKASTVSNFIQKDLLKIIENAFGEVDEAQVERTKESYELEIERAKSYGSADPENSAPVQQAKEDYERAKDGSITEAEIYEHIYRFFRRYYDSGDFLSTRYYSKETANNAAAYSVPYDGREVYFHWANSDQYYTKTSEHLNNFTFDIIQGLPKGETILANLSKSLKLHFKIVEASEGEHNNNKVQAEGERYFIIHRKQPVLLDENNEVSIQFEYRSDIDKTGISRNWQEQKIDEAEELIFKSLEKLGETKPYTLILNHKIGEDKKKRTLLRKYLNQYTKRNSNDCFIHKDLGSFLNRELNFYIKNEVMQLDDIESINITDFQTYLTKIKVLREIAGKLITILSQLENFQKKLWLKKKFVTDTQYCITLDRIPLDMYPEIASNKKQISEWVKLFAIDKLEGYQKNIDVKFLKDNPFLVLDTALFSEKFKEELINSINDFDEQCQGLLVNGDNFHVLNLMQNRYHQQINYIYIDPPYNAKSSEILYKNSYKHSSWLALIESRLLLSKNLQALNGNLTIAIDENEGDKLSLLLTSIYDKEKHEKTVVSIVHNPQGIQGNNFSYSSEYAIFITPNKKGAINTVDVPERKEALRDDTGNSYLRTDAKNCFYPIHIKDNMIVGFGQVPEDSFHPKDRIVKAKNSIEIWPIRDGVERKWRYARQSVEAIEANLFVKDTKRGLDVFQIKNRGKPKTVWSDPKYHAGGKFGTKLLEDILGEKKFDFPKSLKTVEQSIEISTKSNSLVLDYFAGSGTTGNAVININREDGGNRKYIMIEMGNYFDTVTKPRMQKVIYSDEWKDGQPVSRTGSSHAFKYIRLESYEDTLNNLVINSNDKRENSLEINADFRKEYMLNYWLDFETKGSPSLLNIDLFDDPTSYKLNIKKPGSDEYEERAIDLVETFNWLIGLQVEHLGKWQSYTSKLKRELDPELPEDQKTRLVVDGELKETDVEKWSFRKVTGQVASIPGDMTNTEKVLIIWRKLTKNLEEDNAILNKWFKEHIATNKEYNFDVIYVNGSNNLKNILGDDSKPQVRLLEKTFHSNMWDIG